MYRKPSSSRCTKRGGDARAAEAAASLRPAGVVPSTKRRCCIRMPGVGSLTRTVKQKRSASSRAFSSGLKLWFVVRKGKVREFVLH